MGQITLSPGRIVISRWPEPDETVWVASVEELLPYLSWAMGLEAEFTLGDLFHLIDRDDVAVLANILGERLTPVLEEAREGPQQTDDKEPLHFLRVYNWHEDGDLYRGLDAWGTWEKPYDDADGPAGPTDTWVSVSLTPVGRLLHLPIRHDPELVFLDPTGRPEYRSSIGITLLEFLKAIFDDLTFYGSPEERDGVRRDLLRRMEEIERGEAELIPAEEVFRDLRRKLDADEAS